MAKTNKTIWRSDEKAVTDILDFICRDGTKWVLTNFNDSSANNTVGHA